MSLILAQLGLTFDVDEGWLSIKQAKAKDRCRRKMDERIQWLAMADSQRRDPNESYAWRKGENRYRCGLALLEQGVE